MQTAHFSSPVAVGTSTPFARKVDHAHDGKRARSAGFSRKQIGRKQRADWGQTSAVEAPTRPPFSGVAAVVGSVDSSKAPDRRDKIPIGPRPISYADG